MPGEQGDSKSAAFVPGILLGPGRRVFELGAAVGGLAAARSGRRGTDLLPRILEDLEELLEPLPGPGTLVLELESVPYEDIGFVRRFLERNGPWGLVVLGEDQRDPTAQALLALPRARWLPWPPDLDQLRELVGLADPGEVPAPRPRQDDRRLPQASDPSPRGSASPPGQAPGEEEVSLGHVLEELIAGAAAGGGEAPRYLLNSPAAELTLQADRTRLTDGLLGLFAFVQACAGPGATVGVSVEATKGRGPAGDLALDLDFGFGSLTDADIPGIFEGTFEGDTDLADAVSAVRAGAEELQTLGAAVELRVDRPGRLRLHVTLPRGPLPPASRAGSARSAAGGGRRRGADRSGTPQDPFA